MPVLQNKLRWPQLISFIPTVLFCLEKGKRCLAPNFEITIYKTPGAAIKCANKHQKRRHAGIKTMNKIIN